MTTSIISYKSDVNLLSFYVMSWTNSTLSSLHVSAGHPEQWLSSVDSLPCWNSATHL